MAVVAWEGQRVSSDIISRYLSTAASTELHQLLNQSDADSALYALSLLDELGYNVAHLSRIALWWHYRETAMRNKETSDER